MEEDPSLCISFVMIRCSVALMWGVFTLLRVRAYIYIQYIYIYVWWKQIYIWLNHSNILIYYHVGVLLFNIFWNLWHFVQDYLINKKLKRTALIINQHIGMISELLCDTEDWCKGSWIFIYIYTVYTLNKIINTTLLFLPPFFMSWTQRSKTLSMNTKGLFLSNIVHKSV